VALHAVDLLGELGEGRGGASGVMHGGFDLHGSNLGATLGVHPGDQFLPAFVVSPRHIMASASSERPPSPDEFGNQITISTRGSLLR